MRFNATNGVQYAIAIDGSGGASGYFILTWSLTAGGAKVPVILQQPQSVAVVPGNDSGFDTHVRLSFATSMEQIDKGIDRIAEFLKKLA